jgi:CubicO group peptidase (beta-lactamase class C family)
MTVAAPDLSLATARQLFEAEIDRGIETGVQLSVSYRGEVVDIAVGGNGSGHPMTVDTDVPWTCSSKPIGALAFAVAWEAGALGLDTRVAEVLPEFAGSGKELIRVRDLLTHTTGMSEPMMSVDVSGVNMTSWDDIDGFIWSCICSATTEILPGAAMIYNPVTNWFVLDRLLNAITGGSSGDTYRSMLKRLGLSAVLGLDWEQPAERRVTVVSSEDEPSGLEYMNLTSMLPLPGIGVWGPMRDLRVLGEVLLAKGAHDDNQVARPASIEALTSTHWPGSRHRFICDTDFPYGLGVMTLPSLFGRRCSARTFGHAGGNTSTVLVDPLFDLVVAVYWNGRLDDVKTFARRYALVRALYDDLRLPHLPARVPGRQAAAK